MVLVQRLRCFEIYGQGQGDSANRALAQATLIYEVPIHELGKLFGDDGAQSRTRYMLGILSLLT